MAGSIVCDHQLRRTPGRLEHLRCKPDQGLAAASVSQQPLVSDMFAGERALVGMSLQQLAPIPV